jgi:hypothetical protein
MQSVAKHSGLLMMSKRHQQGPVWRSSEVSSAATTCFGNCSSAPSPSCGSAAKSGACSTQPTRRRPWRHSCCRRSLQALARRLIGNGDPELPRELWKQAEPVLQGVPIPELIRDCDRLKTFGGTDAPALGDEPTWQPAVESRNVDGARVCQILLRRWLSETNTRYFLIDTHFWGGRDFDHRVTESTHKMSCQ